MSPTCPIRCTSAGCGTCILAFTKLRTPSVYEPSTRIARGQEITAENGRIQIPRFRKEIVSDYFSRQPKQVCLRRQSCPIEILEARTAGGVPTETTTPVETGAATTAAAAIVMAEIEAMVTAAVVLVDMAATQSSKAFLYSWFYQLSISTVL